MEVLAPNVFLSDGGMTIVRRTDRQLVVFDAVPPADTWRWLDGLGTVAYLCVWPGDMPSDSVRRAFRQRYPQLREVEVSEQDAFPVGRVVELSRALAAVVLSDARVVVTNAFDWRGRPREPLSSEAMARLRGVPLDCVLSGGRKVSVTEEALAGALDDSVEQYSPWSPLAVALFVGVLFIDAALLLSLL